MTLRKVGSSPTKYLLDKLPPVDVERVAADIHVVSKFCEGLSTLYTPHKSAPCMCRAVEVVGEISKKGVARPLSIKPVKKVEANNNDNLAPPDRTEKRFSVADRLNEILSFIETRYKKKALIELDSEYTRSVESLKLLISQGWEFKTRIRYDSVIEKEARSHMEANKLDLYGKWYDNNEEYGGRFQIIGRRLLRNNKIILYLSTRKNLSAQETIDERSDRWRTENLFKNVDIDSTRGNSNDEIVGYYTLAFFMAELSMAFKATTKTIGLIMNRERTLKVESGVMKIHLKNLDRRLLNKLSEYGDYVNDKLPSASVKICSKIMSQ